MFKKVMVGLITASLFSVAAADPIKIKVFTTLSKADEIIDLQKADLPNTHIDVFFVDRKQDIMNSLNSHIPAEKFKEWDEDERYAWAQKYIGEIAPKKTFKIMKSSLGVSYMQLFKINRVPAVLMDDYFLTYGLTVDQSIEKYNKQKER